MSELGESEHHLFYSYHTEYLLFGEGQASAEGGAA